MTLIESEILQEVSSEELDKHVDYIAHLDRLSGTPGFDSAVKYICDKLAEYNVRADVYEFHAYLSQPKNASISITTPKAERKEMRAFPFAFSAATSGSGVEGELVSAENSNDLKKSELSNKVVLTKLAPALDFPGKVRLCEEREAKALVVGGIAPNTIHAMTSSPVWGTPSLESFQHLPKIPIVSVRTEDARYLQDLARKTGLVVRVGSDVWQGWKLVKLTVGTIKGHVEPNRFVLAAGHLDGWWEGATDNATGNATLLEMARVLSKNKNRLRRSVKVAWWPGHSDGRYAGSTWFCDNFRKDLLENCIANINIDSTGTKDATLAEATFTHTGDIRNFHVKTTRDLAAAEPRNNLRMFRAGDHSFLPAGIPSLATYAMAPPGKTLEGIGGSGGKWWWHSEHDTTDKVDSSLLVEETKLNTLLAFRLANSPVLPLEYVTVSQDIVDGISEIQKEISDHVLRELAEKAKELRQLSEKLQAMAAKADNNERMADKVNSCLMAVGRILNSTVYTMRGSFDHDPAAPQPHLLPTLTALADQLSSLTPESNEFRFAKTSFTRESGRILQSIEQALALLRAHTGMNRSNPIEDRQN